MMAATRRSTIYGGERWFFTGLVANKDGEGSGDDVDTMKFESSNVRIMGDNGGISISAQALSQGAATVSS